MESINSVETIQTDSCAMQAAPGSSDSTMEWSVKTVNCCTGCSHDCRYCYAKGMAVRFKQVEAGDWKNQTIRWKDVNKNYGYTDGTVMFPSSHDITPHNLYACLTVSGKLLKSGNKVLIVSKPHLECIRAICRSFKEYKDQILFRFTIGATNDDILSFWEPGAPSYDERLHSLIIAYSLGFKTSVSAEPMLDADHINDLVNGLLPFVTDALWIGTMNHSKRISVYTEIEEAELNRVLENQSENNIKAIYGRYKDNPKIKWKSHIKKIVGIPLAEKPGMDI